MRQTINKIRTQIQNLQPTAQAQPAPQPKELSDSELRLAAGSRIWVTCPCSGSDDVCTA